MENKNEFNKLFISKTLRLTNYLAKKFDIIKIIDDKDNSRFKVFCFEDSQELREYLAEYKR